VRLLQSLTSAVYGGTSVPHVPFEQPLLISFGLDEDKQVSKLALPIAQKVSSVFSGPSAAFLQLW
jgi:hypothetical protein